MLGTCNCGNPDDYDDVSRRSVSTVGSTDSDETDESEALNVEYRKVTPLFRNIEEENWEGVLTFLTKGKWSTSLLSSSNEHLKSPSPSIQIRTWVTSYDRDGVAEWSQLPLHAAISYLAPFVVIKKLVKMYPKSVHCTDNEGMLPIHLAYGFGAPDNVLNLLLTQFPASVNEKGLGGRLPYECCELGPNKMRGQVYKTVIAETKQRITKEIDMEWKTIVMNAQQSFGMPEVDPGDKKLSEFLVELLRDRKDLMDLRERIATRRAAAMAAATATPASNKSSAASVAKSTVVVPTSIVPSVPSSSPSSKISERSRKSRMGKKFSL